jgi:hypothetical protein
MPFFFLVSRYLSAVEKLKNAATEEMRDTRIRSFFDKTSKPQKWVEKA